MKRRFDLPEPDEPGVLICTMQLGGTQGSQEVTRIDNPEFRAALEAADKIGVDLD